MIGAIFGSSIGGFFILQGVMGTSIPVVVVTSGSMVPTIYEGDILFIQHVLADEIASGDHANRTGDVIVYETRGIWPFPLSEPVVHRVIEKEYRDGKWWFTTQGDANYIPDNYEIPEENVYGKVVGVIPKVGWIKLFLDRSGIVIPLLVILAMLLVASIVWDVLHPEKEKDATGSSVPGEKNDSLDETRVHDAPASPGKPFRE
nr:signal peptidase I [Candidatus Sigynarchaeota archaeon]